MQQPQLAVMAEATRLTRQGRLAEATALIQQSAAPLGSRAASATTPVPGIGLPRAPASAPASGKRPGRFDRFLYTNAAGTRPYQLYVPTGIGERPLPLVVMLHGGTQDAPTFAAATGMNDLAERDTFLVAYPEQIRAANPGQYWNWFVPDHQRRHSGEPSLIAGITAQVMDRHPVDVSRVFVAGFSAGGAMAAVMAAAYPDLYAAVGVHSGLAYGAARDVGSAMMAMKSGSTTPAPPLARPLPLIVFHGDSDSTVAHINAAQLIDQAVPARRDAALSSRGQVPGGRAYTVTRYPDGAGAPAAEWWTIHHGGHAWAGGDAGRSYTDPQGPAATAEFIRFFGQHAQRRPNRWPATGPTTGGASSHRTQPLPRLHRRSHW